MAAVTSFCNYPEDVTTLPKIGGYYGKTISLEAIVALSPDLIIGEESAHHMLSDSLRKLNIPIVFIDNNSLSALTDNIEIIGRATGSVHEAAILNSKINASFNKALLLCSSLSPVSVYWEVWDDPYITAGPGSFIHEGFHYLNAVNIFADADSQWPQVSSESIILRNPEVIILSNSKRGTLTVETVYERTGWNLIEAVSSRRVFFVDEDIFSRPGPRFVDGLLQIASLLHPSLEGNIQ